MYIRFQSTIIDDMSTKPLGPFELAYELRDSGEMMEYDEEYFRSLLVRFDDELELPSKFSRKSTKSDATRGISRFKETAAEHINKMREIARIMGEYNIVIENITTETPWYIIYEDEFQIVAEPFKETFA